MKQFSEADTLYEKGIRTLKTRGLVSSTKFFNEWFRSLFIPRKTFTFQGIKFKTYKNPFAPVVYWRGERVYELPIFYFILIYEYGDILEVGNVMKHYYRKLPTRDIIDKFEIDDGVINADAVTFKPENNKSYDLIISVSTLEHIGINDEPKDEKAVLRAIDNLKSLLKPNGRLIFSFPLHSNCELDKLYVCEKFKTLEVYILDNKTLVIGEIKC